MTWRGDVWAVPAALHGDGEPPASWDRDPAREAAHRELSDPRYHEHDPNLLQRAWTAFWDWVQNLFDAAAGATPGGGVGVAVIVLALIALAIALRLRLGRTARASTPSAVVFDAHPRAAAEHRAQADAYALDHDWNGAVQETMRAMVRSLEERGLLSPHPGRTANEAAAAADLVLPGHSNALRDAARAFDETTYGGRTADDTTYRCLTALDAALRRAKPADTTRAPAGRP
ncbi:DUF4129 domain-containing protein [Streptomyces sp. FT1]|uniref:DUF4129 domain-containing protein n=1 Tax=Streptomyces sp. FT1 TaxID=2871486 RepID=UPI002250BF1D|nr:DUF4129 domain-containing protein [Streptomyces sp. FT1]MCX5460508.1 DUF4129 domain-containing protein [Streptomyces sp. FT1]